MSAILTGITDVMTTVTEVLGSMASTITATPLLLLTAVAIPVISFGVGMLMRVMRQA